VLPPRWLMPRSARQCGQDGWGGGGDDAEDARAGILRVAEAIHVAHHRGERPVIDAGEHGSLYERTERVRPVDQPGAHHGDGSDEMGDEVHHASSAGPAPSGGSASAGTAASD
jgi:hypothetical protein